jgi:formamidopyrimidine-DNA glycosylase
MPELPEVETVRRALERHATGLTIERVSGQAVQLRRPLNIAGLRRRLPGRRLAAFRRRAKYLLVDLDPPGTLLVHLGMSGRLLLCDPASPYLPHTHLTLGLDHALELRFVDPRRFGLADWLAPGDEAVDPSLSALGLEPLDERAPRELPPLLQARRAPLKALLLDQRLIAGVGNIYAAEALWRAGVRPSRSGHRTALPRLQRLVDEVRAVLSEAIEQGGTTIRDFASPEGNFGDFVVRLQAYGRAGEECPRCGESMIDNRLAGRSTVWCRRCQR